MKLNTNFHADKARPEPVRVRGRRIHVNFLSLRSRGRSLAVALGLATAVSVMTAPAAHGQPVGDVTNTMVGTRTLGVTQTWSDASGPNTLKVTVGAACNAFVPPFDGQKTALRSSLTNSKGTANITYDFPGYQSGMIHFSADDMWAEDIGSKTAVFVPFLICGNYDQDKNLGIVVFFAGRATLHQIHAHCLEGSPCTFPNRDAKAGSRPGTMNELRNLPAAVQKRLRQRLAANYDKDGDFEPTEMMFSSVGKPLKGAVGRMPGTQSIRYEHEWSIAGGGKLRVDVPTNCDVDRTATAAMTTATTLPVTLAATVTSAGGATTLRYSDPKFPGAPIRFDPQGVTFVAVKKTVAVIVPFSACEVADSPIQSYAVFLNGKSYQPNVGLRCGPKAEAELDGDLAGLPSEVAAALRFAAIRCAPTELP
jgi:hypothetical protein